MMTVSGAFFLLPCLGALTFILLCLFFFFFIETVCFLIGTKQIPRNLNLSHVVDASGSKRLWIRSVLNESIAAPAVG